MRVVIDTNVFVSGVFWHGSPARVLKAWRDGRFQIVLSPAILDEYRRVGWVLARRFTSIDLDPILDVVALGAHIVPDCALPRPVCTDPDDDKFLAAAVVGRADFLVTGDRGLLRVAEYGEVRILAPATFLRTHLKHE